MVTLNIMRVIISSNFRECMSNLYMIVTNSFTYLMLRASLNKYLQT